MQGAHLRPAGGHVARIGEAQARVPDAERQGLGHGPHMQGALREGLGHGPHMQGALRGLCYGTLFPPHPTPPPTYVLFTGHDHTDERSHTVSSVKGGSRTTTFYAPHSN